MWGKEFVYKSFLVIVHLSLFVSYVKKWKLSNKSINCCVRVLCVCVCLSNFVSLFCLYSCLQTWEKHRINCCVHVYVGEILFICFACAFVCKLGKKTSQVILVFLLNAHSIVFIQRNGCTCGWKVSDVYICLIHVHVADGLVHKQLSYS